MIFGVLMRRSGGARFVIGSVLTCLSCGGRTLGDGASGVTEGADGNRQAAGGATTSGASAGAPPNGLPNGGASMAGASAAIGCPAAAIPAACQPLSVPIDIMGPRQGERGVWSEPVQIPSFSATGTTPDWRTPDASQWDRSALPTGACVFRLRGFSADCARAGKLLEGNCGARVSVTLASFYDTQECSQGIAPGCPSANPLGAGSWWYLVPREGDADLVICAPLCSIQSEVGQSCLEFR
jgi:hypothetical protein